MSGRARRTRWGGASHGRACALAAAARAPTVVLVPAVAVGVGKVRLPKLRPERPREATVRSLASLWSILGFRLASPRARGGRHDPTPGGPRPRRLVESWLVRSMHAFSSASPHSTRKVLFGGCPSCYYKFKNREPGTRKAETESSQVWGQVGLCRELKGFTVDPVSKIIK